MKFKEVVIEHMKNGLFNREELNEIRQCLEGLDSVENLTIFVKEQIGKNSEKLSVIRAIKRRSGWGLKRSKEFYEEIINFK